MKIGLVTSKDSMLNVLPAVSRRLSDNIVNLEVVQKVADTNLDVVKEVSSLKGCELIAVAVFYEKEGVDVKVMLEKIVEFDLKDTGKNRIMKFFLQGEDFDEDEESERIAAAIITRLFGKKEAPEKQRLNYLDI